MTPFDIVRPFDIIKPMQRQLADKYEELGHMLLPELTTIDSTLSYHMGADLDGVGFYVGDDPREMVEVSLLKDNRWEVIHFLAGSTDDLPGTIKLPSKASIAELAKVIYDLLSTKENLS